MKILLLLSLLVPTFAIASVDCAQVQQIGNEHSTQIRRDLDEEFDGQVYRMGDLGKLELRGVRSLKFKGCKLEMWVKLKIERPIFGDATGQALVKGNVSKFTNEQVCFEDIDVAKMKLSNTSSSSREAYRALANRALPNKNCYQIKL